MEKLSGTRVSRPNAQLRVVRSLRVAALIAQRWLDDSYTKGARAAAFFAGESDLRCPDHAETVSLTQVGVGLLMIQLSINVVDNAFSTGMDLAGLFSSYLNIRRGAYIGLILSLVMCPWELLSSAAVFLSVLSAYSVFLGPIIGIQVCDYWLIRRRKLKLSDLYHPRPDGIYYFVKGFNPRSFVAWVVGFFSQIPGFAENVTPNSVSVGHAWKELFALAFPLGFAISFAVYYILNRVWPPKGLGVVDDRDYYNSFATDEATRLGIAPYSESEADVVISGIGSKM